MLSPGVHRTHCHPDCALTDHLWMPSQSHKPTYNDRQWIGLRFGSTHAGRPPANARGGWAFLIHSKFRSWIHKPTGYFPKLPWFAWFKRSAYCARPSIHPRNRSKRFLPSSCRNTSWQLVFGQKNKSSWLFIFTANSPTEEFTGEIRKSWRWPKSLDVPLMQWR